MSKRKLFIALLVLVVALILVFVFYKTSLFSKIFNPSIPSPVPYGETSITTEEINLDIPFTSQAPSLNWDQPYQDFCEEASILMAV